MEARARPYRESDRERALELLGDARAIDSPSSRVHIIDDGGVVSGAAVLVLPDAGDEAYLGTIAFAQDASARGTDALLATRAERDSASTAPMSSPGDLSLVYKLAAACARDALDAGFRRGRFTLLDYRLLDLLRRDFTIDARPSGWDPVTARALQWDVIVDLEDALAQLARVGAVDA